MKKSVGANTFLFVHPVLVIGTYDADGRPDIMTAAWGGICNSVPPSVAVSLREATYTHANIIRSGAFTVNMPSADYVKQADFAGIASGRDTDKFKVLGLTPVKSELVNAPYVAEFPAALECRLIKHEKLGLHTQFIGEIVDVKADEAILTDGKPDIRKANPFVFGSFGSPFYFGIGQELGDAFKCGREFMGKKK